MLNLPPDVLDRLSPAHSWTDWLYANAATLLAALVAVGAAVYAWKAVREQIDANAAQLKKELDANAANMEKQITASVAQLKEQLDANAANLQKQLDADRASRARAERLAVVDQGYEMFHRIFEFTSGSSNDPSRATHAKQQERKALDHSSFAAVAKLSMFGLDAESSALRMFWTEAMRNYDNLPPLTKDGFVTSYREADRIFKKFVSDTTEEPR
jgi:uncharacterized protein YfbU (UPF0304 family)